MRVAAYKSGKAIPINGVANPGSVILEVSLDDGRTVQLTVSSDGTVWLRGWGNTPAKVGNANSLNILAEIQKARANPLRSMLLSVERRAKNIPVYVQSQPLNYLTSVRMGVYFK
jgi:hypothetical protein